MTPEQITSRFAIKGTVEDIKPFGTGLINTTYKVKTEEEDAPNYLLQIINHHIFQNVPELTRNIKRVTDHIRGKLKAQKTTDIDRRVLTPIETLDGEGFFKDDEGRYWRMFLFIEGARSYDQLTNAKQAEAGGRAFGQFQKMVSDLPGEPLYPIIPGFHNTEMRINNFKKRVEKDPVGRLKEVKEEVDFLMERSEEYKKIVQMGKEGKIPERIVHQDTKFNNVLLDENDEVLCVIDLDTVMPGYVCYDIGDAIRNGANTGKEDDPNLDNVNINMELYEGFIKGFLQETKEILTPEEKETLAFGAKLLTYEQAVRFLDDYIDGDNYYKTESPEHNLIRTRAQIKLLKSMEENWEAMQKIVNEQ
ncbi:phosphotransferase enzyme family protein [Marinilabilia salmonicolor]|jgi:Ser/Thr protein kinase RdoA (MazF antagonist)|uniref:Phosphotransferase family enzyme n=1 Tax=Marinilabilia salmonicolor TaxID=989 RepID=A0A2T0XBY8_9BACT|nr:aminoglycoside phosphotransferase family protein [Marinilabilia salmonicolor]PRY96432.1 phosphotransferase family enzyme [Marinilabilia salmonicolor]RCW37607.1 phosphotransferase family enzyme [Marinilabilia salmonicolor]